MDFSQKSSTLSEAIHHALMTNMGQSGYTQESGKDSKQSTGQVGRCAKKINMLFWFGV
jgi:hypothetical protein